MKSGTIQTPPPIMKHIHVVLCLVASVVSDSLWPPWTVAHQGPLSMGFSRQEYWSGLLCLPPEDLPNPGIKPGYPALWADSLPSEPPGKTHPTISNTLPTEGDLFALNVRSLGRADNLLGKLQSCLIDVCYEATAHLCIQLSHWSTCRRKNSHCNVWRIIFCPKAILF